MMPHFALAGGERLFVTNTEDSTVSVVDTTRDEIVNTVPVARAPEGIAFKWPRPALSQLLP